MTLPPAAAEPASPEQVDVPIVGAGISGLGAAYYLRRDQPRRSDARLVDLLVRLAPRHYPRLSAWFVRRTFHRVRVTVR